MSVSASARSLAIYIFASEIPDLIKISAGRKNALVKYDCIMHIRNSNKRHNVHNGMIKNDVSAT